MAQPAKTEWQNSKQSSKVDLSKWNLAKGVTAENFHTKAMAYMIARKEDPNDEKEPIGITLHRHDDAAQWGAWRAYRQAKKMRNVFLDSRDTYSFPAEWPHHFDSEWPPEHDDRWLGYVDPEPMFRKQPQAVRDRAVAGWRRRRADLFKKLDKGAPPAAYPTEGMEDRAKNGSWDPDDVAAIIEAGRQSRDLNQ